MTASHNVHLTQAQRKVVADLLPKLADRLKLDEKNPRTISFTSKELESIRQKAEAARSHAENGMIRNSLRHVVDAVTKALEESEGIGSIPASERLYQFKITLLESQPPIWRRIQVKDSHARQAPRTHPDRNGLDQLASPPVRDRRRTLR